MMIDFNKPYTKYEIKVNNQKESNMLQHILFSLDCGWTAMRTKAIVEMTDYPIYIIVECQRLYYSYCSEIYSQKLTFQQILQQPIPFKQRAALRSHLFITNYAETK